MTLRVKRQCDWLTFHEMTIPKRPKLEETSQVVQEPASSLYFQKVSYLHTIKILFNDTLSSNEIAVVNTLLHTQLVSCLEECASSQEAFSQKVIHIYEEWSSVLTPQVCELFDHFVKRAANNLFILLHSKEAQLFSEKNLIDVIRYFFIFYNKIDAQKFSLLAQGLMNDTSFLKKTPTSQHPYYFILFLEQHIIHQITSRKPTFPHLESCDYLKNTKVCQEEVSKKEAIISVEELFILNSLSQKIYLSLTIWAEKTCCEFTTHVQPYLNCNRDNNAIVRLAITDYTTACNFQSLQTQEKITLIKSILLPRLNGLLGLYLQIDPFYFQR